MVATPGYILRHQLVFDGADVGAANPLPITGGTGGGGGTVPTGPAGTPNTAVVTLQGIAGGTPAAVTDALGEAALGTPADAAWVSGSGSIVALLKGVFGKVAGTLGVTGTFWQATQPVSLASLPALPAGAAAIGSVTVSNFPATQPVSLASAPTTPVTGTFWQTTQPISLSTLPAGTNQIGLVTAGGFTALQQATPTVQAAAYAAGAVIGGLITFSTAARISGGSGMIQSVAASFISGVVPSLDVIFFNANPTGSTITDKTALAVATADLGKIIGVAHLSDATLLGTTTPSYVQAGQNAMPFGAITGTTIYAAVVTRTAVTLTSTSDMILSARILQD